MRVLLPAEGGHDFDAEGGDAVGDDGELVLLVLGVEDLPAWERDDAGLDVLLLERLDGLESDGDFGSGGDESDLCLLVLERDVASLDGTLDRGAFELGKVLAGKGEDRRRALGGEGHVVGG